MRMGRKQVIRFVCSVLVILVMISLNFYMLYHNARRNVLVSKEEELLQSAMEVNYFFVQSESALKLTAQVVQDMQKLAVSNKEILRYLEAQTKAYQRSVDPNFSGFYGVFGGEYLDGVGWVPDDDYVPKERPWYRMARDRRGEVAFITPYLDEQTKSVLISVSKLLEDEESVVSMDVSMESIQRLVEEAAIENGWVYGMVLDDGGMVVAHTDTDELGKEYLSGRDGLGRRIAKHLQQSQEGQFTISVGARKYTVFAGTVGNDWKMVAVLESHRMMGSLFVILLVFLATLALIGLMIVHTMLRDRKKHLQALSLNRQLRALSDIYQFMWLIDLSNDTYSEVSGSGEETQTLLGEFQHYAQRSLRGVMDSMSDSRFKKGLYDFVQFETLEERLDGKITITREFVDYQNVHMRVRFVPVQRTEAGSLKLVMWMLEQIDDGRE